MNKILLISFSLLLLLTGCYEEYKSDFGHTTSYFAYQYPVRTFYIDRDSEKMSFKVGAVMGGRYSYDDTSEKIYFSIEDSLITNNQEYLDAGIKVMPSDWYTLSSDSEFVLNGSNSGQVEVIIDRDKFIANADASQNTYAIPFVLTDTTCDSLLTGKNYSVVVVKYKSEFDGRYYVKGIDNTLDATGTVVSSESYSNDALVLNKYAFLNTVAQNKLEISRVGVNENERFFVYDMEINPTDGSATLSKGNAQDDPAGKIIFSSLMGASEYDQEGQTFISKYHYFLNGKEHNVVDTLIFYNRHDQREEWR